MLAFIGAGVCVQVFLDESGDTGFSLEPGAGASSSHFVIALVIFTTNQDAEATAARIAALRKQLGWHERREFKFNKASNEYRRNFFQAVHGAPFKVRVMVVDKARLTSPTLRKEKGKFYNYFVGTVLQHNNGAISEAHLQVDGSGDREFKRAFTTYVREKAGRGVIRKLSFRNSRANDLIQLADMVAGAFLRAYHPTKGDVQFRLALAGHVEDCWEFPRK